MSFEKEFMALELMRKARVAFETRICEASASQDEEVLKVLRLDSMYELAEFYFGLEAMGLKSADDIELLAEHHNERIDRLTRDKAAMKRRGLRSDPLLDAIFTSDTLPRLQATWRSNPGTFDQANLGRFLATQMSPQTVRNLVIASEKAGFFEQTRSPYGAMNVRSLGIVERIFGECLREMRLAITQLEPRGGSNVS